MTAIYGEYSTGKDFERADDGQYVVTLTEIKLEEKPSFNDPNILEPKFTWIFETTSKDTDSNGEPFQFRLTTGRKYGGDKANLTKLIDGIFGRHLTQDEWSRLDLSKLVGQKFHQMISLERNPDTQKEYNKVQKTFRGKGKELNIADFIPSLGGAPASQASKPVDDGDDPFADS